MADEGESNERRVTHLSRITQFLRNWCSGIGLYFLLFQRVFFVHGQKLIAIPKIKKID